MPYFFILVVIILLGLVALREWLSKRKPSQQLVDEIQKKVSREISLSNWEAASRELGDLQEKQLGGVETALLYAQILRGSKQLEEALNFIEESLSTYAHNFSLVKEKGKVLLNLGRAQEALEAFRQSEPILRSEDDVLDFATALLQVGDADGALYALEEQVQDTSNGRVLALVGDCYFYLGDYKRAVSLYQYTQKTGWDNYQVLSRMGHSLRNIGKLEDAETHFRKILDKDPSDVSSTLGLGACLEAKEEYEEALRVYQTGKAWDAGDQNLLRQAGICAAYTQQYIFAELYLRESIKRGAQSPQALAFLGFSLERQSRWEEAEKIYLLLVDEYADHVAGYRALAWLYGVGHSTRLDAQQGLSMARRALELQPDNSSWELLSACEARAGNFSKAHTIQERLSSQENDESTRLRRCRAMRTLRKRMPLSEHQVLRALVA